MATIVEADYELQGSSKVTQKNEEASEKKESTQMIEDKLLLTIKVQEAEKLASTTGSKTMLTLEEQELRRHVQHGLIVRIVVAYGSSLLPQST
jgi:hypothetical protein